MGFTASNRELARALFDRLSESLYQCKLCHTTRNQATRKGYTNLVDHLTRAHEHTVVELAYDQFLQAREDPPQQTDHGQDRQMTQVQQIGVAQDRRDPSAVGRVAPVQQTNVNRDHQTTTSSAQQTLAEQVRRNPAPKVHRAELNQPRRSSVEQMQPVEVVADTTSAASIHSWMEWIVMENRDPSFCEEEFVRMNSKLPQISQTTMISCMDDVAESVETGIVQKLRGRRIGLGFDTWSANGFHFVAIIAIIAPQLEVFNNSSRESLLLTFQPVDLKYYDDNEKLFEAGAIGNLVEETLSRYNIVAGQLCFLVGDFTHVNGSLGLRAELPRIGCASERLNLAAEQHLDMYMEEVNQVEKLMQYLHTSKLRFIVRKIDCPAQSLNSTARWSKALVMLQQYKKMIEYLDGNTGLVELLPTLPDRVKVASLLSDLEKFLSVSMKLQTVSIRDARILFDRLLEVFKDEGSCIKHLSVGAEVGVDPDFENGIVKVQNGHENELSSGEKELMAHFLRASPTQANPPASKALGFADAVLEEKRAQVEPVYENLGWIPPTADNIKRYLSQVAQMPVQPESLELVLYLRFNRNFWNELTVAEVLQRKEESRRRKRHLTPVS